MLCRSKEDNSRTLHCDCIEICRGVGYILHCDCRGFCRDVGCILNCDCRGFCRIVGCILYCGCRWFCRDFLLSWRQDMIRGRVLMNQAYTSGYDWWTEEVMLSSTSWSSRQAWNMSWILTKYCPESKKSYPSLYNSQQDKHYTIHRYLYVAINYVQKL